MLSLQLLVFLVSSEWLSVMFYWGVRWCIFRLFSCQVGNTSTVHSPTPLSFAAKRLAETEVAFSRFSPFNTADEFPAAHTCHCSDYTAHVCGLSVSQVDASHLWRAKKNGKRGVKEEGKCRNTFLKLFFVVVLLEELQSMSKGFFVNFIFIWRRLLLCNCEMLKYVCERKKRIGIYKKN